MENELTKEQLEEIIEFMKFSDSEFDEQMNYELIYVHKSWRSTDEK